MYKYGIVVIGYKNENGIKRLLNALSIADYAEKEVLLIISIDKSENDIVEKIANRFIWEYGEKKVVTFPERLGLRNHVLHCGDYLNTYDLDALAVFEDDTLPARGFFRFMVAATEKYIDNENIAGISLYAHHINFNTREKFIPIFKNYDNYFLQCAQSWGQVWFKKQWNEFRDWYKKQGQMKENCLIPDNIVSWPETSWLKYHIKYCIEKNKYFVYPYNSYTTCFSDIGEHAKSNTNDFQVPISNEMSDLYNFMELDDTSLKYDAFFENQNLHQYCNVCQDDLLVDLYGDHIATNKRYILTRKQLPYKIINSWDGRMVPHEMNVIYNIPGDDIVLYDLEDVSKPVNLPKRKPKKSKNDVYFDILDKWMKLEEAGYNVQNYFLNKKWNRIAIYGKGKIGMHLYNRLKNTDVHVEYFIDRSSNNCDKTIQVINPQEKLPDIDVVVVTPVMEFEQIKKSLQNSDIKNIISLDCIFN